MEALRLGRTDITASRSGFGALPIQRVTFRKRNCSCKDNCPYGLDTPNLLRHMLEQYHKFYAAHQT